MGEGRVFQRDLERMKQEGDELSIGQENGQQLERKGFGLGDFQLWGKTEGDGERFFFLFYPWAIHFRRLGEGESLAEKLERGFGKERVEKNGF